MRERKKKKMWKKRKQKQMKMKKKLEKSEMWNIHQMFEYRFVKWLLE